MARVSRRNLIKTENVEVINSSRVGIYTRLSQERTEEWRNKSHSIESQVEICQEYVNKENMTLVKVYTDYEYSGTNFDIDNYKELRKEMCELKRYIEQDCRDNGAVDDETWKGNHRYLSDYRNQMTHRNSPNVTGVLGQEFNMKTPPIYLIKRTSEDYSYIINKLASLTEKIESELIA